MKCLVKIYDTEQVNNLISILAFKPQSVVFLYDKKYTSQEDLISVQTACVNKIQNINFEFVSVDSQNLYDVERKCKNIVNSRSGGCVFDITGGEELAVIGMYLCCTKNFTPIYKLDIDSDKLVNVYGCSKMAESFSMPNLDLETILMSKGARIDSSFHPTPDNNQFNNILSFCNVVFDNIISWKELCAYIQNGVKNSKLIHMNNDKFSYYKNQDDVKTKIGVKSENLLKATQKFNLINNLEITNDNIAFKFNGTKIERYMTDFGSWLELYTYINIKRSNLFSDVKMSVKIGWDGDNPKRSEVTNEIDVTFFNGITPVFVSCKLSDPNAEALQELSMYQSYFGGKRSKCILVTIGDVRGEKPYILNRAAEMGIHIIDKNDIKSGEFVKKINKAVNSTK